MRPFRQGYDFRLFLYDNGPETTGSRLVVFHNVQCPLVEKPAQSIEKPQS